MVHATSSMLHGINAHYLEDVLRQYRLDPTSVEPSWRAFFEGEGRELVQGPAPADGPRFRPRGLFAAGGDGKAGVQEVDLELLTAQVRVVQLIDAYRAHGHFKAALDPLGLSRRGAPIELDPWYWGFTEADMDQTFSTAALFGPQSMTLREVIAFLEDTYARSIGAEFMHINDAEVQAWLQERCERTRNHCDLDRATQIFIVEQLAAAEAFEQFLHVKYRGKKRFSLEGAEALIPMLALLVEETARRGVSDVVMGMAHRGRLNVLANIFGKNRRAIFGEFDDMGAEDQLGRGDVKYHLGYSSDQVTRFGHRVHLSLTCNPSHLEAVNPVVEGRVRAKQDRFADSDRTRCLPVLIHGDAAFPGQGLVSETLNLMGLEGYSTGGTIHIIVNNQIGFTTVPEDSRSSPYCTDIAKMNEVPIFHVNGEDPEAVAQVVRIAAEFRQTFHRDVIIDMYCFRRYGHNEGDEPAFTQPLMYQAIDAHPPVLKSYATQLETSGLITTDEVAGIAEAQQRMLEEELEELHKGPNGKKLESAFEGVWSGYHGGPLSTAVDVPTAVPRERLEAILKGLATWPDDFQVNPKIERLVRGREKIVTDNQAFDWGTGELLAYGALVLDGHPVRISGQDVRRGTFSHRHAVLTDPTSGRQYTPLANLSPDQARFEIYNSPLSEAAVLGFEYGYAMDTPEALVIWEAQFGDFVNGAQVIIDQFIVASEDKWRRNSGVVLLLPHGYEGQGPEHSSGRVERFLQMCAEDNIQVCNVTTPGQMFHLLRRQVLRKWRKPLVVMTPKSLLRHKRATSTLSDLAEGGFERVIPERLLEDAAAVQRVVLCSGKVYYDLLERREATGDTATALVRVEELYPFPEADIRAAVAAHPNATEVVWCQEEPENMGSYYFMFPRLYRMYGATGPSLRWESRAASASPATGSPTAHSIEQADLLDRVFGKRGA